ncbi:MAG: hypothetical protein JW713_10085 [Pontiellaceae bacterium]|nr:hypothetical protein [Pontiellaceae bacterium]
MKRINLCLAATAFAATAMASDVEINIDCAKPTLELSPYLYGLFFEDINYAADGGLYAELVQNRSFEFYKIRGNDRLAQSMHPLFAWEAVERDGAQCSLSVEDSQPLNGNNTHYLKIDVGQSGAAGVANAGFDGFALNRGDAYDFSVYARNADWSGDARLTVTLETEDGTICGKTTIKGVDATWQKLDGVIKAKKTADAVRLVITAEGQGSLYLDMVSLFPQDTFMGRKNGMRKDLGQALKDLNPKFLRFPGGCIAHGDGLDNIYRWKDTVGDVAERKPNWNRWGYHQTYGLGYYEYFQLCEDIGATPLPVIPVGVSCGFTPPQECVPMDELGPWIQDALDLIEFANGPVSSKWGGLRAEMGHPEPFGLQYVALGNEPHNNALFRDRFPPFVKAIREKYPEIRIAGTSGLGAEIPVYDLMTEQKVFSSDEHYYMSPDWFLNNTDRFDDFDRSKPQIFVGEYAAHDTQREEGMRVNTLYSAIAEAAFLTGVERNGDMVDMTCYAPLFGHKLHSQWSPDMIYFDNRNLVKSANYYVQQLFACNKGDAYLSSTVTESKHAAMPTLAGAVGIGSWETAIEVENVKVNGRSVDLSKWSSRGGDFELKKNRLVQRDSKAQAAMSVSAEKYDGDTVTYTLRARRTAGNEGFLIQFGSGDGADYWWNIGGWGNTRHALQRGTGRSRSEITPNTPGHIENGMWYDIKVVMGPGSIKCYLNDELIHDYEITPPAVSISSTYDKETGDVIIKLVNPREQAVDADIVLDGVDRVSGKGTLQVLAGERNSANSFEQPAAVTTQTRAIEVGKSFRYTMPAMSVQFIRINTKNLPIWTREKAAAWEEENGWLRGCNFNPSTSINQLEFWQAETFDPETIDRELGWAEQLGLNCMRVYLHHVAWEVDKDGFKDRVRQYLDIADSHGIKTIFVIFDDCWNARYQAGKQPDPKPGVHNSGWVRDPGDLLFDKPELMNTLEVYVKDMLTTFGHDERIALWDLYNEPGNFDYGNRSLPLLQNVFEWAWSIRPDQPLSAGLWHWGLDDLNAFQLACSDVITYHNYNDLQDHRMVINKLKRYDRPMVCTEYMARRNDSLFQNIMPMLKLENVGAINWGLVAGKSNTKYAWDEPLPDGSDPELWFHEIFRPDGTPYSQVEANVIRGLTIDAE